MAEEKMHSALDKIEKLIVDGQKDVIGRVEQVEISLRQEIQQVETSLRQGIQQVETSLRQEIQEVKREVRSIDKKYDVNTQALYGLLQDVRDGVKKVNQKLDEHICQPAHADVL